MSPEREGKSPTRSFSAKSAASPMLSNRAVSRKAIPPPYDVAGSRSLPRLNAYRRRPLGCIYQLLFESLRHRVQDCRSRVVITSDGGKRGGKSIAIKAMVVAALKECPLVKHVLVLKRTGVQRDRWFPNGAKLPLT